MFQGAEIHLVWDRATPAVPHCVEIRGPRLVLFALRNFFRINTW